MSTLSAFYRYQYGEHQIEVLKWASVHPTNALGWVMIRSLSNAKWASLPRRKVESDVVMTSGQTIHSTNFALQLVSWTSITKLGNPVWIRSSTKSMASIIGQYLEYSCDRPGKSQRVTFIIPILSGVVGTTFSKVCQKKDHLCW